MFVSVRNDRFDEILSLVETFQGTLSLSEILNQEIPILNALKDAKIRLTNKQAREREAKIIKQQNQIKK